THIHGQLVVLGAMGLVGDDNNIIIGAQDRKLLVVATVKFMDERKYIAMIFAEQLLELLLAVGPDLLFGLGHCSHSSKVLINLVVQVQPVGNNHKLPVAGKGTHDLAG